MKACAARPRWPARDCVLSRPHSAAMGAPCVLVTHRPSRPVDEGHSEPSSEDSARSRRTERAHARLAPPRRARLRAARDRGGRAPRRSPDLAQDLPPEAQTRYRVLRRSVTASIIFIGLVSALLVIPQVRAVAGGLLASSAVLGLVIGFAARSTLANWVAGLLIALAQPIRLGDLVCIEGEYGTVEEIGLTYTRIRTDDLDRLVIPNEKLAVGHHPQLDDRRAGHARRDQRPGAADDRARPAARGRARLGRGRAQDRGPRHRPRGQGHGDRARPGSTTRRGPTSTPPTFASASTTGCGRRGRSPDGREAAPSDRAPERRPAPPAGAAARRAGAGTAPRSASSSASPRSARAA